MREGTLVLVTIDGAGPMLGRLVVEHVEAEQIELDAISDYRASIDMHMLWRVELDEIPQRHWEHLRNLARALGPPAEVRLWHRIGAEHYTGQAYVEFGDAPLRGGPWPVRLLGQRVFLLARS